MIESFKNGGKVPKRVAWEIILGVQALVVKESSLVEVVVHKGATCDVVGDSELKTSLDGIVCCKQRARTDLVAHGVSLILLSDDTGKLGR